MLFTLVTVTLLSIIQFVPNRFELIAVSIEMTTYINKVLKVLKIVNGILYRISVQFER